MTESAPSAAAKSQTGGFFASRELARIAGAKGGRISRRTSPARCRYEMRPKRYDVRMSETEDPKIDRLREEVSESASAWTI